MSKKRQERYEAKATAHQLAASEVQAMIPLLDNLDIEVQKELERIVQRLYAGMDRNMAKAQEKPVQSKPEPKAKEPVVQAFAGNGVGTGEKKSRRGKR